jgi:hypothetical protein
VQREKLDEMTRLSVDQERRSRRGELPAGRKEELNRYWRGLAERMTREGRLKAQ